uniref:Uncharacterized protein n=1 Tax=Siphoviridae sp. ct0UO21 TaxID=2825293 RepID=A0A8S5PBJ3_9CAUD|nr:MAG TPA: hypothetical protein [Siphoviridae sp. ct0UO21]
MRTGASAVCSTDMPLSEHVPTAHKKTLCSRLSA